MRGLILLALIVAALAAASTPFDGPRMRMERAALALLASLDEGQRARIARPMETRREWNIVPGDRPGVTLGELTETQRSLAHALLRTGLSQQGYLKADAVIQLEHILREMGENPRVRDPGRYVVQVFSHPESGKPWAWRIEGHHLSLLFTFGPGPEAAVTPMFFGANPAHVHRGSRAGLRVLWAEEDLARELLASLTPEQRETGVLDQRVPADIIMGPGRTKESLGPAIGLLAREMKPAQQALVRRLVEVYVGNLDQGLAEPQRGRLGDLGDVRFLWIGSDEPGRPHYYRLHAPGWVIEYDNTQDGANHVHTIFRDFERDFGADLLRDHLERDHGR